MRASIVIGLFAALPSAFAACTGEPAFVDPVTFADTTPENRALVVNNRLLVAIRYATTAPLLTETKNNGNAVLGANAAQTCFTFPTATGVGWTYQTQTRTDDCKVDLYSLDLTDYLSSPSPATGYGCGTISTDNAGTVETFANLNIMYTDTTTTGRAQGGQIVSENPLVVQMVTPLFFSESISTIADASDVIDITKFSVNALFTRKGFSSIGSFVLTWSLETQQNWKNLKYATSPLTLPAGFATSSSVIQMSGNAPTTVWSGTVTVQITNFCSGISNPQGTYTLNFKAALGNSNNFNKDASVTFIIPSGDLCSTFIPNKPSMVLSMQDAAGNPFTGRLVLGNSYAIVARINSVFGINWVGWGSFPQVKMVTPATGTPTTTYDIIGGTAFNSNQEMSSTSSYDATGATVKLFFTVKMGASTDNVADWFFLANEIPANGIATKTFTTTLYLNVKYYGDKLTGLRRRDMEFSNFAVGNLTYSVVAKSEKTNASSSIKTLGYLTIIPIIMGLFSVLA